MPVSPTHKLYLERLTDELEASASYQALADEAERFGRTDEASILRLIALDESRHAKLLRAIVESGYQAESRGFGRGPATPTPLTKVLPTPPLEGPPLPRGLGVKWPMSRPGSPAERRYEHWRQLAALHPGTFSTGEI